MAGFHVPLRNVIGCLVLCALSLGALAIAWSMVGEELRFLAGSRIVTGEVVDHVRVRSESRGSMQHRAPPGHYAVVRFQTASGQVLQVQARAGHGSAMAPLSAEAVRSGSDVHPVGSTMRVAYRPDQPEDARVLGFSQQYLYPLLLAGIGLVLLVFAVLVLRDKSRGATAST